MMVGSQEVVRTNQGIVLWDIPRFAIALLLILVGGLIALIVYGFAPILLSIFSTEPWISSPWSRMGFSFSVAVPIVIFNFSSRLDYRIFFNSKLKQLHFRNNNAVPFKDIEEIKVLQVQRLGTIDTTQILDTYLLGLRLATTSLNASTHWVVIDSISYLVLAKSQSQEQVVALENEIRSLVKTI